MLVGGLLIAANALFITRQAMPTQDAPIALPVSSPKPSTPVPSIPVPSPTPAQVAPLYVGTPKLGQKIGTIYLKSLHLSWPIIEGTNDSQLARGVGHYVSSVLPGYSDNTVLSGHRSTVFNRLGELNKGDLIYVRTSAGVFTYQIYGFKVVLRNTMHAIVSSKSAMLTLTTCYPFNNIGATNHAFLVSAKQIAANLATRAN